jgi:hypothetical protein
MKKKESGLDFSFSTCFSLLLTVFTQWHSSCCPGFLRTPHVSCILAVAAWFYQEDKINVPTKNSSSTFKQIYARSKEANPSNI